MTDVKVLSYTESINGSLDKIVTTVQDLSEETIRWKPAEDEWSILQILNHVNEATLYWLSELETILEQPGSEWGRGLQNPDRLEAVESPDELDVNAVIAKVKELKPVVTERLSKVDDERLTEENPHRNFAKFGNKPVSFLIEHFLVEHVEGHYNQIQRNLSKLSNNATK
ncbi:DinB family protein [Oceanobacillus piezotolerans]|uniref:DinB family protein n=1 Tax=Oceanobacillus piezotolerans TaxID=2448030 RepID=A0A498DK81_9BACI|nr:DinB family protein [Oceanobacillus piezotolerans]RLL46892.1 DinB family protein [Oceanobacillus piezotolerans]